MKIFFALLFMVMAVTAWSTSPAQSSWDSTKDKNSKAVNQGQQSKLPVLVESLNPPVIKVEAVDKTEIRNDFLSAEWASDYVAALLAIITAVLAFYTYRLYSATVKLGTDAKETSLKQILITERQTEIIEKQAAISQQQFIAQHRPKIVVRFFRPDLTDWIPGNKYPISFNFVNEGGSTAQITEIGTSLNLGIGPWTYGSRETRFVTQQSPGTMEVGNIRQCQTEAEFLFDFAVVEKPGVSHWYCAGYIEYIDEIGNNHRTGFCRKFNYNTKDWERELNEDYEYYY